MSSLSDDQIDEMIRDPLKIETHEQAEEIIDILEREIAGIAVQIDACGIEALARPLSPDRQAWLQRASYAKAMRVNEKDKVHRRDRELRGMFAKVQLSRSEKKEANLLKQQRLMAEAQNRREEKRLKHEAAAAERSAFSQGMKLKAEIKARHSFQNVFQSVAKEMADEVLYARIMAETKARVGKIAPASTEPLPLDEAKLKAIAS